MMNVKKSFSKKNYIKINIVIVMILLMSAKQVYAVPIYSRGNIPIVIDGYFDDWSDKPYSWEYVWDNPDDYWENGEHIFATDENGNKYNEVIRHKMSLLCDGEFIYLYIKMAQKEYTSLNGNYYEFFVDEEMAAFYLTTADGSLIDENSLHEGINEVLVKHVMTGLSGSVPEGSKAFVYRRKGGINDELELRIPLKALNQQNPSIDIEHFKNIQFFTPVLMYRRITSTTTSTYPYLLAVTGIIICSFGIYKIYKKEREH